MASVLLRTNNCLLLGQKVSFVKVQGELLVSSYSFLMWLLQLFFFFFFTIRMTNVYIASEFSLEMGGSGESW